MTFNDDSRLRADLALSEEKLAERTHERDNFELRLIESDHELTVVHSEFTEATRKHAANIADLTIKLVQAETQVSKSNSDLTDRTEDLALSTLELKAMQHERGCFIAALSDLRNPITSATQMLEYIAAGKVEPERQAEILAQIIDANKRVLLGADRLAAVASELSQRANQLAERTEELAKSNAELKARMQQREDFVAALTHDLKNPLIGSTRILELFAAGSFAERQDEQAKVLNLVIESNKGMLRMIWNMLDIYKQESGRLQPVLESVNVTELLKQCLSEFSFNIQEKKLRLIFDAAVKLPSIQTDRILLRRVLFNLFDNGVKFSPEGGELTVGANFNAKEVSIYVKDSGPGVPDKQREQIFQCFWQTRHGREKGIGTGLGLFSSKQIMDSLGGRINCSRAENGGTIFTVTMYLAPCSMADV